VTDLQRLWATYLPPDPLRYEDAPWWRCQSDGPPRRADGVYAALPADPASMLPGDAARIGQAMRDQLGESLPRTPNPIPSPAATARRMDVDAILMRHHDRTNPLPCPEPACGQVWAWPDGSTIMVQAVAAMKAGGWGVQWPGADQKALYPSGSTEAWPPPGAHLVNAVGGGPWSPPDTPEEP